ncbi:hypothetical protein JF535_03595 [Microbulbifer salipaludis]|uniref:Lipoprotein n=1 Tax=Microbulbifer salipaludis TaxID=187980 RepID=A0ABS3E3P6_9GAMM|nr:hypothetical protein [Microbulbifer salipaludis]MBN8429930.1 hypothetical protein [Microbulbifer salipaludis]
MKRSFAGLAGGIGAAALLAMSGCTSMENMTDTTTAINRTNQGPGYYSVQSRYYHCHQNGRCHNVRHPNYYMNGGEYRRNMPQNRVNQPR